MHALKTHCFKLPKWNGFSLKSERRLLAPPSGFIPRKVLASKLGGGLNQLRPTGSADVSHPRVLRPEHSLE